MSERALLVLQLAVPRKLDLGIGKVRYVASGGSACAAMTGLFDFLPFIITSSLFSESGQVYVWGYGIVGQGPEVTVRSKPSLLPPPLFGANEFESNLKVRSVHAGIMHFAAINSKATDNMAT